MNVQSRHVMLAGLALVVAGLAFAFTFGIYVEHEARLVAYDAYRPTFEAMLEDESGSEWQAALAKANAWSMSQRRAATVHTHSVNMGVLLMLGGLLLPLLRLLKKRSPWLPRAMIGAAWVYPIGLLLKFAGFVPWGEALAGLGAALAIVAMLWLFVSVSRALDSIANS